MIHVRPAEEGDAAKILELVRSNFARLDPELKNKRVSQADIEAFGRSLGGPSTATRSVAVGRHGIEAYMKTAPWGWADELPFSDIPELFKKPVLKGMGRFGWFRDATGLFTLSTPDGKLADVDAVNQLVEESGLLSNGGVLYIPALDADAKLRAFLVQKGAVCTEKTAAEFQINIGPSLPLRPMPATLWRRERHTSLHP